MNLAPLAFAVALMFGPKAAEVAFDDLAFERATEEFVAATAFPRDLPEPYRSLIGRLGSAGWKERDAASKALEAAVKAEPAARRWLWWARKLRDPEVQHRANVLIRRLSTCAECHGTGCHREWRDEWGEKWDERVRPPDAGRHPHSNWAWGASYECCLCGGSGVLWTMGPWD